MPRFPSFGKKRPDTVVRGRARQSRGTAVANPLAGAQGDDDGVRRQLFREPIASTPPPPSTAQVVRDILSDPRGAYTVFSSSRAEEVERLAVRVPPHVPAQKKRLGVRYDLQNLR